MLGVPASAEARPAAEDPRAEGYRQLLQSTRLFGGATPAALDALLGRVRVRSRSAGAAIVGQGEASDALFIVYSGTVKVVLLGENGREVTLSHLATGDFFGELGLLEARPRAASVVAVEDAVLLQIPRDAFLDHLRNQPQTALNMLSEMAQRLRRADEAIADLALHDVEARLVRTLIRLAENDGQQVEGGLYLRRRPTQQELANMVGSCRETVSRTMTALKRRGLLSARGRGVVLASQLLA